MKDFLSLEGVLDVRINDEIDNKVIEISNDIQNKLTLYKNLTTALTNLQHEFDIISVKLREVSIAFKDLSNAYNKSINGSYIENAYENLSKLTIDWSRGYVSQKTFFEEELTSFFKYISQEVNVFTDIYEEYNVSRNNYLDCASKISQNINDEDLLLRSRFYQSMLDTDNLLKGQHYSELPKSFVIFICRYDPIGKNLPIYTFENRCLENLEISLNDKSIKKIFNATAYNQEKDLEISAFLEYIYNQEAVDDFTSKLTSIVERLKKAFAYDIPIERITPENSRAIWQKSNDLVCENNSSESKNIVDKYKFVKSAFVLNGIHKSSREYYAFIDGIKKELAYNYEHIFVNLTSKEFVAPNPYLAKRIYDSCEILQDDILLCQLICEICLDKMCQKTKIYVDTKHNYTYLEKLINFLNKHKMRADISFFADPCGDVREVYRLCAMTSSIVCVSPVIEVAKNDNDESVLQFISELSKIYPRGMLTIVE